MPMTGDSRAARTLAQRRKRFRAFQRATEVPMLVLSIVWVVLFVVELTGALTPPLAVAGSVVWAAFIADFLAGFVLAPVKLSFLRHNWIPAISLLLPAARLLRIGQVAAVIASAAGGRAFLFVRIVARANRGVAALGKSFRRRGAGYVAALTVLVTVVGAAGMLAFEGHNASGRGLPDYPTALWWTAMIMTTMGSEYWPQTAAGRVLCLLLALYAFSVFGYVTAALATFFVGRDAHANAEAMARRDALRAIRAEIAGLRAELRTMSAPNAAPAPAHDAEHSA
jgi:voltage-gated potassium channel